MFPHKRIGLAVTLVFMSFRIGWAAEYEIDTDHSKVMFKIKHLGISTVTGRFEKFSGTFQFDSEHIEESKAYVQIETASINTDVVKRDEHLRTSDFFDVEKFPEVTFSSQEIRNVTAESFEVLGDLTLHGITQPVVLKVEVGGTVKDPWGKERAAFTASADINRQDFGIIWNKTLETGGLVLGEKVRVLLEIEGIRKDHL